jgi:superfamily II DNA/RNA helicase
MRYLFDLQIYDEARKFTFQTGIRPVVIYGGAPVVNQVGVGPCCLAHL